MMYLARRLKSFFFWGLALCLLYWQSLQPAVIVEKLKKDQIEINHERWLINNGHYDALTTCRDGWRSSSAGQGTCSWHGGVDHGYYRAKFRSQRIARQDINDLRDKYQASLQSKIILFSVLIFLFSPMLDLMILGRESLYGGPVSGGASPLATRQLEPQPEPAAPARVIPRPPENGLPACPLCGSEMRTRTARHGRNRGNTFLGCSTYPRCRGTRQIHSPEA